MTHTFSFSVCLSVCLYLSFSPRKKMPVSLVTLFLSHSSYSLSLFLHWNTCTSSCPLSPSIYLALPNVEMCASLISLSTPFLTLPSLTLSLCGNVCIPHPPSLPSLCGTMHKEDDVTSLSLSLSLSLSVERCISKVSISLTPSLLPWKCMHL
ncbi:TECTA [Acanthosepion pharaonis]|uniref:TECTA n=1 Tax=Acanthosepion pharaonis TaxID=158019 RepID=A0A812BRG4_ACAPH|nr:TECTA [Sepia pharaonis]